MEEEIWKPVPSISGMIASSFGRIKLPERIGLCRGGNLRVYKTAPTFGTKTKASKNAKHLYLGIYNRTLGNMKVHRLVCEAFHGPPPFPRAVVLHLDENGLNNRPENLKWGTQKENLNAPGFIEYCKGRIGEKSPITKHLKKKGLNQ